MWLIDKVFGTSKAMEDTVDLIDNAWFTDEERAEEFRNALKGYEPFKVAQRFFMVIVCIPYMVAWFVTFMASFFIDVTTQAAMLGDPMYIGMAFVAISGFYFGGGMLSERKK